jgi:PKD repeat protein
VVTVKIHDNGGTLDGGVDTSAPQTFNVTVSNVAPSILTLTLPIAPVAVGTTVNLAATFSDPGTADVHTALIDWEDGTSSGTVTEATQSVAGTHVYAVPGIYTVKLTVSDGTDSDSESFL